MHGQARNTGASPNWLDSRAVTAHSQWSGDPIPEDDRPAPTRKVETTTCAGNMWSEQ